MMVDLDTATGACALTTEFQPEELGPSFSPRERAMGEVEARFDDGGPLLLITCADTATALRLAETAEHSP